MKRVKRLWSVCLVFCLLLGMFQFQAYAAEYKQNDSNNNQVVPHEEWTYTPGKSVSNHNAPYSVSLQSASGDTSSAGDIVKVHVTATDRTTSAAVAVPNAEVKLYVGGTLASSTIADENGNAEVSLSGLSLVDRRNATISASKIVSRGTAINGNGRDALFQNFPKDESGQYYRYSLELHSESIDSNGNWCGAEVPVSNESNKIDIVFAIDATGSMSDEINNVKTNIAAFSENLIASGLDIRFSIIEYRDITEGEETIVHTFSGSHWVTDIDSVVSILQGIDATGGGDGPETVMDALGYVADNDLMRWRSDAYRFAFVLTDADYKTNNNYGYTALETLTTKLANMNVVTSVITSSSYKSTYAGLYNGTGGIYANINSTSFDQEMMNLSNSIIESVTRQMTLSLCEPRMLVNMSVCYLANDSTSQSLAYENSVKNMLNEYANRIAETSDGHVLIDKLLLFSTNNRLNFYTPSHIASMADIRIETTEAETIRIHSNAKANGFYTDELSPTDISKYFHQFASLPDSLKVRNSFWDIQLSGTEGAGWNYSMLDAAYQYSTTVAHETGHYLFGFFDEYMNENAVDWRDLPNKPYEAFGLMDNQHDDIEMSKDAIDYAYIATGGGEETYHWNVFEKSCEATLADLLTTGNTSYDDDKNIYIDEKGKKWRFYYYELPSDGVFDSTGNDAEYGQYRIVYSKAKSKDRTATYSYAGLSDRDFLSIGTSGAGGRGGSAWSLLSTPGDILFTAEDFTKEAVAAVAWETTDSALRLSLTPHDEIAYTISYRKAGDETYSTILLSENTAVVPCAKGELAEIRIAADDGEAVRYNTYYIDRSADTDAGYIYTSADNAVMAYVTAKNEASFTFIADNTVYTKEDYVSVNQATHISSDNGAGFDSGEIYSVADYMAEIDYTTLSWFKYADGVWTALATDYSDEETMNIGARADLDGEGLYVLMAKPASMGAASQAENLTYTQSTDRDAVVTLSFIDPNANSKYYNVYYSESPFTDKNADGVVVKSFDAGSTDLTLNLIERNRVVYASVEIVLHDGTRSALSEQIRLEAGEADSDGDGIPDWYCDQYRLWPKDGEEKDIANSDDDGDGLTNLQEYLGGSDPTDPNDPEHTTNIPVTSISVSEHSVALPVGGTIRVTATVLPENATNQAVNWASENPEIATVTADGSTCVISGVAEGSTQVYAVTADGGFSSSISVTVGKYTVTYTDGVDGAEVFADQVYTVELGDPTPAFSGTPFRTGYTFAGWSPAVTETVSGTVVYTAQWTPNGGSSGGGGSVTTYPVTNKTNETNGSVKLSQSTASSGTLVTVTVTPDSGYVVDHVNVTDKNGNTIRVTDKGDGTYTFIMPASRVWVEAVFAASGDETDTSDLPFLDVPAGAWYESAVRYVYEKHMMSGTGEAMFSPAAATTRGMIVTILYRLEGSPAVSDPPAFNDVPDGQWYSSAVAWAAANDIVGGYGDGLFGPNDTITREQMAAILYRYAQYKGYDVTAAADLSGYSDAGSVSAWAQAAMQWANGAGLITGNSATTLNPLGSATRAEVAAILMRFCEDIVE